jgi:hypothetical protein
MKSQRSAILYLLSAMIKGISHYTWLTLFFSYGYWKVRSCPFGLPCISIGQLFPFFFFFFGQGFSVQSWLSWNSLCRPGWPRTQKSTCLCLPNAGITGTHHHCPVNSSFLLCPQLPLVLTDWVIQTSAPSSPSSSSLHTSFPTVISFSVLSFIVCILFCVLQQDLLVYPRLAQNSLCSSISPWNQGEARNINLCLPSNKIIDRCLAL